MVHLDPQINMSWPQPQCVDCTTYQPFRGGGVESAGEVFIEFQEGATP